MDEKQTKPRRPLWFWLFIGLGVVVLIFGLGAPSALSSGNEKSVTYDVFLTDLEAGKVKEVELKSGILYYTLKETAQPAETEAPRLNFSFRSMTAAGKKATVYTVTAMNDPDLVTRLHEAGVTFSENAGTGNMVLLILLQYLIPILFYVAIFSFFFRRMGKLGAGGGLMGGLGKSNARTIDGGEVKTTFADVAGQDEAKESLQEIVSYLHNPQEYTEIGARMPRGALLIGPPGTGKTLMARAVAGEAGVPFLSISGPEFAISGPEFVELFVGMGASKVRDLFKEAREKAPCIVFIDEIDAVGKKRDGIGGNDEREQTLNQLLSEMDGFEGNSGVVILAATNRPESLDKALLRPGRFDRRVPVELPDQGGREAILRIHCNRIKTEGPIDLSAIARITPGASGADLANVINEAALCAVRSGRHAVTQKDLEDSVDVALAGKQRKSMVISPHEKEIIAYHEVGHALVAARQKGASPVHKITIIPRTSGALGFTMQADEDERFLMDKQEAFAKIVTLTGGRAAEELCFDSVTTGASNDIEQATSIARAMITRYGMSESFGMTAFEQVVNPYLGNDTAMNCSQETAARIDREVIALIDKAYDQAKTILKDNRSKLDEIARVLIARETITGQEFMDILNAPVALPPKQEETEQE